MSILISTIVLSLILLCKTHPGNTNQNDSLPAPFSSPGVADVNTIVAQNETHVSEKTTTETVPSKPNSVLIRYLSSRENIFSHVNWGNESTQNYSSLKSPEDRTYFGYGSCPKGSRISYYPDVLEVDDIHALTKSYAEMFRQSCNNDTLNTLIRLFDMGYANLEWDHSVSFSIHAFIFIKQTLTYAELEDLQSLIELCAFSQVYVSWFMFPVASIDPLGEPITDACFIELVASLHALDLTKDAASRYLERISYTMATKLKPKLTYMRDELKTIHGTTNATFQRITVAVNSLAVIMGLFEFLMKHPEDVLQGRYGCAHATFKIYYAPKRSKFVHLAKVLGRLSHDKK